MKLGANTIEGPVIRDWDFQTCHKMQGHEVGVGNSFLYVWAWLSKAVSFKHVPRYRQTRVKVEARSMHVLDYGKISQGVPNLSQDADRMVSGFWGIREKCTQFGVRRPIQKFPNLSQNASSMEWGLEQGARMIHT